MADEISMIRYWQLHDTKELKESYYLHWYDTQEIPQCHVVSGISRSFIHEGDTIRMISYLDFVDGSSVELKDNELLLYGEHYGVKFQMETDPFELPAGFFTQDILRKQDTVKTIFEEILHNDGYIAGGFARYVCSSNPHPANYDDIDLWTDTPEKLGRILNRVTQLCGEPDKTTPISLRWHWNGEMLNLVTSYLYDVSTQVERFDTFLSQFAILNVKTAIATWGAMDQENAWIFSYNHIDDPVRELKRMIKYAKKGYRIADRAIQDLFVAIQDKDRPDYSEVWKGYEE